METSPGYHIAEVAERTGFATATLRYYEQVGLLPAPRRAASGYRRYDDRAIERLRFVARAKQLGCSLDEITELVHAWDTDRCAPVQERLRTVVQGKLVDTQARIAELLAFAADLAATAAMLDDHPVDGPCDDTCGCTTTPAVAPSAPVRLTRKRTGKPEAPPIACTLGGHHVQGRLDAWHRVLAYAVARRAIAGGVRVSFAADVPLPDLVALTSAEHDCCRFFAFAITIDTRGVALEVTAPEDAEQIITALFGAPA